MLKSETFLSEIRIIFLDIVLKATPTKIGERFAKKYLSEVYLVSLHNVCKI